MVKKLCKGVHKVTKDPCRFEAVLMGYCLNHYFRYVYRPKKKSVEGGENGKKKN